jgi:hypothetical protein|tara:strand:+ start:228 stop:428 length:201 start_codon:yes stop_codon:yes gene_type:complete
MEKKSVSMKQTLRTVFPAEMDRIDKGECPFCSEIIDSADFKDALSTREYEISGMCQVCQDNFFQEE